MFLKLLKKQRKEIKMRISGLDVVSHIIKELYKATETRKSLQDISKICNTSINTVLKVREILITEKLLVISGERKNQISWWAPGKCAPNDSMNARIHSLYIANNSKVKKQPREKKISIETALHIISDAGFTGKIQRRKTSALGYTVEIIDLSNF